MSFLRRNRVLLTSALCLVLAAGLALQTSRAQTRADWLGRVFLEIMAPLQRSAAAVGRIVAGGWRSVTELVGARAENVALRERTRRLEQELDRLSELDLENTRLRKLLDFRDALHGELLTARIIGRDATGLARTITIDGGEADGIVRGAAALAPEGVVGQVFLVSRNVARILLISDHNSGVDALVQRTRARGIVQGTVDAGCVLKYVKRTEDVQVGDALVTSGLDGIFPKGLPVGHVAAIDKRGPGLFQSAEVAPRVDFDRLEEVLVTRGPVVPAEPPPAAGE
ncbi:MAG TPA: rod shape-determining protein MreC [Candidatus Binatus sp.]|nr:rod shape-determining protein MreC [Candidatus Binatus sp.]